MRIFFLSTLLAFSFQAFSKSAVVEFTQAIVVCDVATTEEGDETRTCSTSPAKTYTKTFELTKDGYGCSSEDNVKNFLENRSGFEGGCLIQRAVTEGSEPFSFYTFASVYTHGNGNWHLRVEALDQGVKSLGSVNVQNEKTEVFSKLYFSSGSYIHASKEYHVDAVIKSVKVIADPAN